MGIGYFSAAEGIVGDNIHPRRPRARHRVRAQARARPPRARGEHPRRLAAVHDLLAAGSTRTSARRCSRTSRRSSAKNEFVTEVSHALRRDLDMTDPENKRLLAKNIFVFGQCMEGTQFYGLFGMILSLYRQGKLPGHRARCSATRCATSPTTSRSSAGCCWSSWPRTRGIWTADVPRGAARADAEAVALEKEFIARLPAGRGRRPQRRGLLDRTSTTSPTAGS